MKVFVCPKCKRKVEALALEVWCPCRMSEPQPKSTLMKEQKVTKAISGNVPDESIVHHG